MQDLISRQRTLAQMDLRKAAKGTFTPPPGQGTPQPGQTAPGSSRYDGGLNAFFSPPPGQGTPQPGQTAPGSSRYQEYPADANYQMAGMFNPPPGRGTIGGDTGGSTRFQGNPIAGPLDARYRPFVNRGTPRTADAAGRR